MRGLLVALALSLATPAVAAPNAQLVASVQSRLDRAGFAHVDAGTLTTRQIAALHLQLSNRQVSGGFHGLDMRGKIEVILGWD